MDIMRGAACAMILGYHLRFDRPIGLGQAAMEIFFVISGYLITRSLVRDVSNQGLSGIRSFAWRRTRRLLPAMIVFLIGALFLNLTREETSITTLVWASFSTILGGYNFHQVYLKPNIIGFGGIWSLSLEEQFYFTVALFTILARFLGLSPSRQLLIFAATLIVFGICFRIAAHTGWYTPGDNGHLPYLPPLRLWGFGLGALVAFFETRVPVRRAIESLRRPTVMMIFISSTVGITMLIASVSEYNARTFLLQWAGVPALTAILVCLTPRLDEIIQEWNNLKPLSVKRGFSILIGGIRIVGLASYSIYLWHCLVIAGFVRFNIHHNTFASFYMLALSLILGLISWKFVEMRFYEFGDGRRMTFPIRQAVTSRVTHASQST
jgi:peptidoglycan/LPS O-acetylase OafA/YrhL